MGILGGGGGGGIFGGGGKDKGPMGGMMQAGGMIDPLMGLFSLFGGGGGGKKGPFGFLGFKKGGRVPGKGSTDSVAAKLTPGEVVIPKGQVPGAKKALSKGKKAPTYFSKSPEMLMPPRRKGY